MAPTTIPRWPVVARIFIPFAAGYFLSYALRNVNAVIAPDLVASLGIAAGDLGLLTSAYFLAFAAAQLPVGVLLDRVGPRRVETVLLVCAALGAFVFASGERTDTLLLGRALIGIGVSACLMGSFKAFSMWFPPARLPLVNGCVLTAGGLGALAATAPVEIALEITDWRGVYALVGVAALASAALIFVVVPRHASERSGHPESIRTQARALRGIYEARAFWRIAPVCAATQGAFMSIQGLWAGPWLADVAGLDRREMAFTLAAIPPAMIAGFFLVGLAAERLARLGVPTMTVANALVGCFLLAQLALVLGLDAPLLVLWCAFGFLGTASVLYYPILAAEFAGALTGRVHTALNLITFSTAFAAQWGLGAIIERWPGADPGTYATAGYQAAFATALAVQAGAFALAVLPARGR